MTRAAAYCRVSTDRLDQLGSFESQKLFFKSYIECRPGWTLIGIYADEGITGTTTADRTGFLQMLVDAYSGRFDVILTKEVSRFSRNLLDAVAVTRELKRHGVAVVFLNDGISTSDPDAELRLGIMASVAQEESRKTSERVKWGQQRKMERGVVFGRSLLGYNVRGGIMCVEPRGAETVRMIFALCLRERLGVRAIAAELSRRGIATQTGARAWSPATVLKILRNEKYCGDLKQRKTVTTDYLTHYKKRNRGEAEFVFIQDHHEPIVGRGEWEAAQAELSRRASRHAPDAMGPPPVPAGSRYALSGKITCASCRRPFVSRMRPGAGGARYRVWTCRDCVCAVRHGQLREDALERLLRDFIAGQDAQILLGGLADILSLLAGSPEDAEKKTQMDISHIESKAENLADAYLAGDIGRETYLALREKYAAAISAYREKLRRVALPGETAVAPDFSALLAELAAGNAAESEFYLGLVEKIIAHQEGAYDIYLKGINEPLVAYKKV